MRNRLLVFLLLAFGLVFGLLFARQLRLSRGLPYAQFAEHKLRILTYSTFLSSTGPGTELLDAFKHAHGCEIEAVTVNDSGLLLERLKLAEQAGQPVDVVLGLDQLLLKTAETKATWREIALVAEGWSRHVQRVGNFIPFDWSPLSFIYRKGEVEPPQSFAELLDKRFRGKFALQDPRLSSPGQQFYNWVRATQGGEAEGFLSEFKANVQSVSPSWAFSYGLFKDKKASFVFSYLTSLAFHWGTEHNRSYQIVSLPEGHPKQIEYVGVPTSCRECALGEDFVRALLQSAAQKTIMLKNFMRPVVEAVERGTIFAELPELKIRDDDPLPEAENFETWDNVFTH